MYSIPKSKCFSRIVLASGSPRRKDILTVQGGLKNLEIIPSTFEEEKKHEVDKTHLNHYIETLALGKATQVANNDPTRNKGLALYIGSDTCVCLNGRIFEKPTSFDDAVEMLTSLSGSTHQVCSGVAMLVRTPTDSLLSKTFNETTEVTMGELSSDVINAYVTTGEPMDKAGGYGLQSLGAQLVRSMNGDYFNVVGFPLFRFCKELESFIDEHQLDEVTAS